MIELQILKLLLNKENWNKYNATVYQEKYLNHFKETNPYVNKLLLSLIGLQEANYQSSVPLLSPEALKTQLFSDYPGLLLSDEKQVYEELFQKLAETEVPEDASKTVLERLREAYLASSIEGIAHEVCEQRKPFSALLEACNTLDLPEEGVEEGDYADLDLGKALTKRQAAGELNWRLKYLRKSLGPLRKGDFGFIFARPESGKTTFLISEVCYFLAQTERPILWFANEEEATGIISRMYSALLAVPISTILAAPASYVDEFLQKGGSKIRLCDNAGIRKGQLYQKVRDEEPALVIIDQLDKVHGFDAERHDLLMKAKYQWARELAKEYCPVIGVCQAGGTAEGKMWLDFNDVDSSHTAKQGEADWIMGIGKSNNDDLKSIRYLNVLKNKLLGGPDSVPELRHSKTQVKINLERFIYEDIVYK